MAHGAVCLRKYKKLLSLALKKSVDGKSKPRKMAGKAYNA